MRKYISASMAVIIAAASVLTGCSGNKVSNGKPTIKVFMVDRAEAPISNNMPVIRKLEEKCNINIEFELAPATDAAERFNLVMASNDVPDIVIYHPDDLIKYTKAFEPLDELIGQYTPNLKAIIDSDESIKKDIADVDGHCYILPMISAERVSQVYFARRDWMEKLGINMPETTEDLYNMLKAFKENDPNGNGKADEIPFVTRNKKSGLMPFVEAFGIQEEFFVEDGKVKYGAIDPRMKESLEYLHKLYSEGLIDKEYLTADSKEWQAKVTGEQAGCLFDWVSRIDFFNNAIQPDNPKAEFVAILPPTNGNTPRGLSYQMRKARDDGAAAISRSSKYKKEIMEMYNYIYSDEGTLLVNFGIEGEHYSIVDGVPVHNDNIMHSDDGQSAQINLWKYGINIDWPCKQDPNHEKQLVSDIANEARKLYNPFIKDAFPKLRFTDEERSQINAKMADIKTYKDESIDGFITGTKSLNEFDQYVAQLKGMGIEEVLDIYNKALEKYNK